MSPAMRATLASYFAAEKGESVVFVACGAIALLVSAWLWISGNTYKGLAIPLVLIGLIQIGVGGAVYLRTDEQVATLTAQLASEPSAFAKAEAARMKKVLTSFRTYKLVELAIFALGVALTFAFAKRPMVYSAGIGCIAQAAVMLVCDLFAEHRGQAYLDAVRGFVAS